MPKSLDEKVEHRGHAREAMTSAAKEREHRTVFGRVALAQQADETPLAQRFRDDEFVQAHDAESCQGRAQCAIGVVHAQPRTDVDHPPPRLRLERPVRPARKASQRNAWVPKQVIRRSRHASKRAKRARDTTERLLQQGVDAAPTTPEQLAAFQRNEIARWAKVVKAAGVIAE
jgi:hypothetical protein